jgi:hypothetical protein
VARGSATSTISDADSSSSASVASSPSTSSPSSPASSASGGTGRWPGAEADSIMSSSMAAKVPVPSLTTSGAGGAGGRLTRRTAGASSDTGRAPCLEMSRRCVGASVSASLLGGADTRGSTTGGGEGTATSPEVDNEGAASSTTGRATTSPLARIARRSSYSSPAAP